MSSEECEILSSFTINILTILSFLFGYVLFKYMKIKKETQFKYVDEKLFNLHNFNLDRNEVDIDISN